MVIKIIYLLLDTMTSFTTETSKKIITVDFWLMFLKKFKCVGTEKYFLLLGESAVHANLFKYILVLVRQDYSNLNKKVNCNLRPDVLQISKEQNLGSCKSKLILSICVKISSDG